MPVIYKYNPQALRLAYLHRVYFRFQTHSRIPLAGIRSLPLQNLGDELRRYGLHLLELASDDTDIICQVSLRPEEAVATAASKVKGRLSKFLRSGLAADAKVKILGKGYFGCTVGNNTRETIVQYLEKQGIHHGYLERPLPPVYVQTFDTIDMQDVRLDAAHNVSLLRYHLVFGTHRRKGIFTQSEGDRVAAAWKDRQVEEQFVLLKVSFVPDHVHIAVRVHPSVVPGKLMAVLMNVAEERMEEEFSEVMIRHSAGRLWETGGYVGSFGELTSTAVRQGIARWKRSGSLGAGL